MRCIRRRKRARFARALMPSLIERSAKPISITAASQLIEMMSGVKGAMYFRGQSDVKRGVLPTIARLHCYAGHPMNGFNFSQERDLFHQFRRHTYPHRQRVLEEWEALFLARHHGLPVRLLDWTYNPLVALYWACKHDDISSVDGAIWAIRRRESNKYDHLDVFEEKKPFGVKGIRLIYPYYPTQRMVAQAGLFTIHGDPSKDLTRLASNHYDEKDCDIETGQLYLVPKECKPHLLLQLERCGINARTLLPELDGIASGLWQTQVMKMMPLESTSREDSSLAMSSN